MFIKNIEKYNQFVESINISILNQVCKGLSMRITEPLTYNGFQLYFLDLTTLTETGTFKDIVGSYIISHSIQNKIPLFITQSSGNTANSIAFFASVNKIKVIILYPKISRYKINSIGYSKDWVTFIEVDKTEEELKDLTQSISNYKGIPWLPNMKHQIEANKIRAYFINEFMEKNNISFDYTSQSLSSGYGIFGLYEGFSKIQDKKYSVPSFIGVQQESIKPYKEYLYNEPKSQDRLIEPTLFRSKPTSQMLVDMKNIIEDSKGLLESISFETYEKRELQVIELLKSRQIEISKIDNNVIEKAGIISTLGVLQAIENNKLKANSNILITITGGQAKGLRGEFIPDYIINKEDTVEHLKLIVDNI
jgi:threonine synthase